MRNFWSILLLLLPVSTNAVELLKYFRGQEIQAPSRCPDHLLPPSSMKPVTAWPAPLKEEHAIAPGTVVRLKHVDRVFIRPAERSKIEIAVYAEKPQPLYSVLTSPGHLNVERTGAPGICSMQFEGDELIGATGTCSIITLHLAPGDAIKVYRESLLLHGPTDAEDLRNLFAARRPDALEHLRAHGPISGDDLVSLLRGVAGESRRMSIIEAAIPGELGGASLTQILAMIYQDANRLSVLRRLSGPVTLRAGEAHAILDLFLQPERQADAAEVLIAKDVDPIEVFDSLAVSTTKPRVAQALASRGQELHLDQLVHILTNTRLEVAALEILSSMRELVEIPAGGWKPLLEALHTDSERLRALAILRETPRPLNADDALDVVELMRTADSKRAVLATFGAERPRWSNAQVMRVLDGFRSPYATLEVLQGLDIPLDEELDAYLDRRFEGFARQTLESFRVERWAEQMRAQAAEATGLRAPQSGVTPEN